MIFRNEINESLTLKFAEAVKDRKQRGEDILSLGLGEPDFNPPPELIIAFQKALTLPQSSKYSASAGLLSLRQKIAGDLQDRTGIKCAADNLIITPGTKQSVILTLMALLEPGDEVIIIEPAYVSYIPQVYLAEPQAKVIKIQLNKNNYKLDLNELQKALSDKTKAIILNTPHNPTGIMLPEEDIRKVYEMTQSKRVYILSDEIYEKIVFRNIPHFSIGSLEENPERIITLNGFGKSMGVTGWRIGYTCGPNNIIEKINKLQQHINTNTSTVIQMAFDMVWPLPQEHLKEYNKKLSSNTEAYLQFLAANPILTGSVPEGSFFAFVNIGKLGINSIQFASKLVELTGVAVTAGIAFGKDWDDHIRISLTVDTSILNEAFNRINTFIIHELWK